MKSARLFAYICRTTLLILCVNLSAKMLQFSTWITHINNFNTYGAIWAHQSLYYIVVLIPEYIISHPLQKSPISIDIHICMYTVLLHIGVDVIDLHCQSADFDKWCNIPNYRFSSNCCWHPRTNKCVPYKYVLSLTFLQHCAFIYTQPYRSTNAFVCVSLDIFWYTAILLQMEIHHSFVTELR